MSKTTTNLYHIELQLKDKTYESKGKTVLDALNALKKPEKIMQKAMVRLTKGALVAEKLYFPGPLKRLFYSNDKLQSVHAKHLQMLMK